MSEITASAVKELRDRTGVSMMACKQALVEAQGNLDAAIEILRKMGKEVSMNRSDRDTDFGRMGIYASLDSKVGAMVELKCESAPVAGHDEFIELANALARQLATGPGASSAEELLQQPSPSRPGSTLGEQKDDLFNRMREVMNIGRMVRINGACEGYTHNAKTVSGVLTEVTGGSTEAVKNICMHIAAMRPQALTTQDLDPQVVAKEREILMAAARQEGKPDNILEKMVEGRLRGFYAQTVLLEQPYVKEAKFTVGQYAKEQGFEVKRFVLWELGVA
ncbi:MAG TPA: translation elongation factor Ts [Pirellulaceae bacterium]